VVHKEVPELGKVHMGKVQIMAVQISTAAAFCRYPNTFNIWSIYTHRQCLSATPSIITCWK